MHRLLFPFFGVLIAAALAGCGVTPPDAVFVGSRANGVYARLPGGWLTMSAREWDAKRTKPEQAAQGTQGGQTPPTPVHQPYYVFFGKPVIDADLILTNTTVSGALFTVGRPSSAAGEAVADDVEAQQRVLFATLPEMFTQGVASLLRSDILTDGRRGHRFEFTLGSGDAARHVVQETVLSKDGTQVFGIAVGCAETCFNEFRPEINRILTNWGATK